MGHITECHWFLPNFVYSSIINTIKSECKSLKMILTSLACFCFFACVCFCFLLSLIVSFFGTLYVLFLFFASLFLTSFLLFLSSIVFVCVSYLFVIALSFKR